MEPKQRVGCTRARASCTPAGVWLTAEVLFYCLHRRRWRELSAINQNVPSDHDVEERIANFLTLTNCIVLEDFISAPHT